MKFEEYQRRNEMLIKPLLPLHALTGIPRPDDKTTLNDIFFVLMTGCKWEDMVGKYGS
ncbi:MAG: transposase [Halobacteriota archaeon]|nr:transposase [Halobacteriota archaeon]